MYNVAAFSFEVKNYISELGLAKEFDILEGVEINKTKYNLIAEKELLNDYKQSSEYFEQGLNEEVENIRLIPYTLNNSNIQTDTIE